MGVRVAIDAMGGDFGSKPILEALPILEKTDLEEILLVGDPAQLEPNLNGATKVSVVPSGSVVEMSESASVALKKKQDSSISVATKLVREGRAQAIVSAGHTGATMASALTTLGRLEGVKRPAITTVLPTGDHPIIVLDVGANVDVRPEMLVHFAIMGSVYAEEVLERKDPRVGLLSIGTEESKGNEQTLAAFPILKGAPVNFAGNMEGRQVFGGEFDVVVCDGFVGNILLKFGEATTSHIYSALKEKIKAVAMENPSLIAPLREHFEGMFKQMDHEEFGGAPLLGVNGTCMVCHGGASARAIANAAIYAASSVEHKVNQRIVERLSVLEQSRLNPA